MLMHALEVLCNEPWCCILCWQFDMQFSYATRLAHPVLCRPTHYASGALAFAEVFCVQSRNGALRMSVQKINDNCMNTEALTYIDSFR